MKNIHEGVATATSPNSIALTPTWGTSFLFLIALLWSSIAFSQDQFKWTGNDPANNHWENANNWDYYPYAGSTKTSPAPFYPGQVVGGNPFRGDDIAIFDNSSTVDCLINSDHTGDSSGLRIGGLHVRGFGGVIKQSDGNRFIVSESVDAGGNGFWDGTTPISSTNLDLVSFTGLVAYEAIFDFAAGGEFLGGSTIVGGIVPSYALLFAVPLTIENTSKFTAPRDETRIRHNAAFFNGLDFYNLLQGAVVLSNRTGGAGTRQYSFNNTHFWDLKVTPNGALPRTKEFIGGTCIVENNFMTTGLLGALYGPSESIIMNAPAGIEVHIENDIIIGNIKTDATLTAANAFGDLVLVMNSNGNQNIEHSFADVNFQGNLPHLRIEKPTGQVTLIGPVTVNGEIEFVSGRVRPANLSTQTALTRDVFVLNSNATVTGMSDASFCSGAIRARTGKTIELPIGKGGTYRPALVQAVAGVSADNSIQNMYRAEYFEELPAESPSIIEPDLSQVSSCEVWAIQKEAADAPDPWTFDLELSYNPSVDPSCTEFLYPTFNPYLVVTRWDHAVEWVSHGDGGDFSASNGDPTVRTNLAIVSSDFKRSNTGNRPDLFTFGELEEEAFDPDSCLVNVCVDYCQVGDSISFTPNIAYGTGSSFVGIFWDFGDGSTSTALTPTHAFSSTGVHFVDVTVTAVSGADTCSTTYTFGIFYNDCSLPVMESIRQTPTPQKESKEIKTMETTEQSSTLLVTPNPATDGVVQFLLDTKEKGQLDYKVTNHLGQIVLTGQINTNEYWSISTTALPAATYIMTVEIGEKIISQQFVIKK